MLRVFTLATRKFILPRPLPVYSLISDAACSSSTAIHLIQRDNRVANHHRSILPLAAEHNGHRLLGKNGLLTYENLRWASGKKDVQFPSPSVIAFNMINMLECVDLQDMKDSPPPLFWIALTIGGSQVVIPLLEIIGGYSELLTIFQLYLAALTVANAGGIKWGLAVSKNSIPPPTWDTMKWVLTPTSIAILGLQLPYPLGFLTVGTALVSSLYLDLKSCAFPPWGLAVRVFLAITTLTGLLMALTAYLLFHDRDNKEKKDKMMKEKATLVEEQETGNEEEGEQKSNENGKNGKNVK